MLDEPTNHLDLPSIERLEDAMVASPGTLVLVGHDDRFAARCTTATWRVAVGQVDTAPQSGRDRPVDEPARVNGTL